MLPVYERAEAIPKLRLMLEHGGSASFIVDSNTRVLSHVPAIHRPISKLPWPLSGLQPHGCDLSLYQGNQFEDDRWDMMTAKVLFQKTYLKRDFTAAIRDFLQGSDEDSLVFII